MPNFYVVPSCIVGFVRLYLKLLISFILLSVSILSNLPRFPLDITIILRNYFCDGQCVKKHTRNIFSLCESLRSRLSLS